jgi:hypothetical protein
MTWEGQRIGRLMRYLTLRVGSPPPPLLAVAALHKNSSYIIRQTVTATAISLNEIGTN